MKKILSVDILSILLTAIVSFWIINNLGWWRKKNIVIAYDVISYYAYLPATFIYDDVTLNNPNEKIKQYPTSFLFNEDCKFKVYKTTMGMSMLYAPFFGVAHSYAKLSGDVPSGFSEPYQLAINLSAVFYVVLGFVFVRKILLKCFDSKVRALTILLLFSATNLFFYTTLAPGMPHAYLFALVAGFIFFSDKYLENQNIANILLMGLLFGLLTLIRPIMAMVVLYPVFAGVISFSDLKRNFTLYFSKFSHLLLAIAATALIWLPQLIYWKIATGNFWFYSYTDEGFFWTDPKLFDFLFSFRKGWLLYSPFLVFSLISLLVLIFKREANAWLSFVIIALYAYVASCWWTWWFGGGYGSRTMIDLYAFLAIPTAYFVAWLLQSKKIFQIPIWCVIILMVTLSFKHARHYYCGQLHHDSMTKEAYSQILLKLPNDINRKDLEKYWDHPNYAKAKRGEGR
jgi:hypothetical protein